jgi:hypothetical protein
MFAKRNEAILCDAQREEADIHRLTLVSCFLLYVFGKEKCLLSLALDVVPVHATGVDR